MKKEAAKSKNENFDYLNELIRAYRQSHAIFSAVELGLFDALVSEKQTVKNLTIKLKISRRGVEMLLHALVALGIVTHKNNFYKISNNFKYFLNSQSPESLCALIEHEIHLQKRWGFLSESIRTGKSARHHEQQKKSKDSKRFINAMCDIGRRSSTIFLKNIIFRGDESILDLGGGPGKYLQALCEKYEDMHVTLFDQPETVKVARQNLKNHYAYKRMHFVSGDLFSDPFGGLYDVVLLSNVIHIFGEDEILFLFKKCHSSLKDKGRILVKDLYLRSDHKGPLFTTLFALHMLVSTNTGKCYTGNEVLSMLNNAKFKTGVVITLTDTSSVIEGIKT